MAHPDAETEAAPREFVDQGRGRGVVRRQTRVEVRNGGAQVDPLGRLGQGQAKAQTIPDARAVDPRVFPALDLPSQFKGGRPAARNGGDGEGGERQVGHWSLLEKNGIPSLDVGLLGRPPCFARSRSSPALRMGSGEEYSAAPGTDPQCRGAQSSDTAQARRHRVAWDLPYRRLK